MIAIVDYNAGNLTSVAAAVRKLGQPCIVTSSPAEIEQADRVIFPGVGAAGAAMRNLTELGLRECLKTVIAQGKPFLGICLGYQILFQHAEEDDQTCLGVLEGNVVRFDANLRNADGRALKIPHMGWNEVVFRGQHPVWDGVPAHSEFYFVHSYHPVPRPEQICASTTYGVEFASGVACRNLVAFQFHPEKSGRPGLKLLDNFCKWQPAE